MGRAISLLLGVFGNAALASTICVGFTNDPTVGYVRPTEDLVALSDEAFLGEIVASFEFGSPSGEPPPWRLLVVRVERVWLGYRLSYSFIRVGPRWGEWQLPFREGERYLFFGAQGTEGMEYDACTGTRLAGDAYPLGPFRRPIPVVLLIIMSLLAAIVVWRLVRARSMPRAAG